jgi:hypothetical protein
MIAAVAVRYSSGLRFETGLDAAQALYHAMCPPDDATRALTYFSDDDFGTRPEEDRTLLLSAVAQRGPAKVVAIVSRELKTPDPETLPDPSLARGSPGKATRLGRGEIAD